VLAILASVNLLAGATGDVTAVLQLVTETTWTDEHYSRAAPKFCTTILENHLLLIPHSIGIRNFLSLLNSFQV
jgi:hypothetical protein